MLSLEKLCVNNRQSSLVIIYLFFVILLLSIILIMIDYQKIIKGIFHIFTILFIGLFLILFPKVTLSRLTYKSNSLYRFTILCCIVNIFLLIINRFFSNICNYYITKLLGAIILKIWPKFEFASIIVKYYFEKPVSQDNKNVIDLFRETESRPPKIEFLEILKKEVFQLKELNNWKGDSNFNKIFFTNTYKSNFFVHLIFHLLIILCTFKCSKYHVNFLIFTFVILGSTALNNGILIFHDIKEINSFMFVNKIKKFILTIIFCIYFFNQLIIFNQIKIFFGFIVFFILIIIALYFFNKTYMYVYYQENQMPLIIKFLYGNYIHVIFAFITLVNFIWIFYIEYKSFDRYFNTNSVKPKNNKATF